MTRSIFLLAVVLLGTWLSGATTGWAQKETREQRVRGDKARVEAEGFWLYNDLDQAYKVAAQTGKPILVVLRCLPCEECVKLDDELLEKDPTISELLKRFVCVRVVGTNGLDLDIFQFDTDQSFAVFMLNADRTLYGRFGTRSHRTEWVGDVSLPGMARAMEGALALHARFPRYKSQLAKKRGPELEFPSPEKYPSLKDKYSDHLNYAGDVVKSCIHCHQIGDAQREFYWHQQQPIPDELLYPYPHPKSIGLVLDPDHRAKVKGLPDGLPAAAAGLQVGDEILTLDAQPLLSMADVQWVLHQTLSSGASLPMTVRRNGQIVSMNLTLQSGWRSSGDTSWRVSSWPMRRIATGGMRLIPLTEEERQERGIVDPMALRAASVGQYGPHAAAKKAGFKQEDVVIAFDGQTNLAREQDVFAHVNANRKPGEKVSVRIRRGDKTLALDLPIQR